MNVILPTVSSMARKRSKRKCAAKSISKRKRKTAPSDKKRIIGLTFFQREQLKAREIAKGFRSPFVQLGEPVLSKGR